MLERALFRYEVLHLRKLITLYLMIMNRLRNLTLKPSNTRDLVHTSTTRELKELAQLVAIQTCHRMEGIKATPLSVSVLSPLILHILQVLNSVRLWITSLTHCLTLQFKVMQIPYQNPSWYSLFQHPWSPDSLTALPNILPPKSTWTGQISFFFTADILTFSGTITHMLEYWFIPTSPWSCHTEI